MFLNQFVENLKKQKLKITGFNMKGIRTADISAYHKKYDRAEAVVTINKIEDKNEFNAEIILKTTETRSTLWWIFWIGVSIITAGIGLGWIIADFFMTPNTETKARELRRMFEIALEPFAA